jgi:predicted site-specific integrase-resolvase
VKRRTLDEIPELVTYAQAAAVLGISTRTIGRYVKAGLLDAVGFRPYVTRESIKRLLNGRQDRGAA